MIGRMMYMVKNNPAKLKDLSKKIQALMFEAEEAVSASCSNSNRKQLYKMRVDYALFVYNLLKEHT